MNKLIFIDVLTTGLNIERSSLYRIGGVICEETPEGIIEKERFDLKSRPFENARISDAALWTGGETLKSLSQFPEQQNAFGTLIELLNRHLDVNDPKDKYYLCGFDVSAFGMQFLRRWFTRNENNRFRDYFHVQSVDLMSLSAFALMDERQYMPDFHLATAARFLDIKHEKERTYSCIANTQTCIRIYMKLAHMMKHQGNIIHRTTSTMTTNYRH